MSEPLPEPVDYEVPDFGGCLWPVDPACFSAEWEELDEDVQLRARALATSSLERLVAYRVGNCPTTIRPCVRRGCWTAFVPFSGGSFPPFNPGINREGDWINGCGCSGGCASDCEVRLPAPVGRIDEVKVDGVILNEADYRIDNGNILVWMGTDECPFFGDQDLSKPDTEVGTFSVTYLNAYPVDSVAAYANAVLAMEFAKACIPKAKCLLPTGVTSIVRQGVAMTIQTGAFPGGLTGLRIVDAFIALWNPGNLPSAPAVWFPGASTVRF